MPFLFWNIWNWSRNCRSI